MTLKKYQKAAPGTIQTRITLKLCQITNLGAFFLSAVTGNRNILCIHAGSQAGRRTAAV